jgi:hypothetical protein
MGAAYDIFIRWRFQFAESFHMIVPKRRWRITAVCKSQSIKTEAGKFLLFLVL